MNTLKNLKDYIKSQITLYPELKEEMTDLYDLCLSGIEDGESVSHEIELCITDINFLIDNHKENERKSKI